MTDRSGRPKWVALFFYGVFSWKDLKEQLNQFFWRNSIEIFIDRELGKE